MTVNSDVIRGEVTEYIVASSDIVGLIHSKILALDNTCFTRTLFATMYFWHLWDLKILI